MIVRSGQLFKTDRLFYVYLFLHLTLKKCCVYIELNHIPVVAGSDGQHNPDMWDATDWTVYFQSLFRLPEKKLVHRIET